MVGVDASYPLAPYAYRELLTVYCSATPAQRRRGRSWYPTMRRLLRAEAEAHGYTLAHAVSVLAITSPGAQLGTNLEWTLAALQGETHVGRYPNVMEPKIRRALAADRRTAYRFATGPKVAPFHRAIMGDTGALVIDRWAIAAANPFRERTLTDPGRRALESAYRQAAAAVGETVRAFQAIVWLAVRETTPDAAGRVRRLADITC